jgi:hypothetical protein
MTGDRPKVHFRAIFDVTNPKEVGRDPFAVRRLSGKPQRNVHGDDVMEREFPLQRKDTVQLPLRTDSSGASSATVANHGRTS